MQHRDRHSQVFRVRPPNAGGAMIGTCLCPAKGVHSGAALSALGFALGRFPKPDGLGF